MGLGFGVWRLGFIGFLLRDIVGVRCQGFCEGSIEFRV